MDIETIQNDIIQSINNCMINERLQPEPHFSYFSKFLAMHSSEKSQEEAIVHLANSQGVHLRNDVKYLLQRRNESVTDDFKIKCPVLESSHLEILKNYNDLISKLEELPSEWTVVQITKGYTPFDVLANQEDNNPVINIARFPCGKFVKKVPPYFITLETNKRSQGNMMDELQSLIKSRREYYKSGATNRKLREEYNATDSSLMNFVNELDNHCLKEWKCLLTGSLEDSVLEEESLNLVREEIEKFFKKQKKAFKLTEKDLDIVYLAMLSSHMLKNRDILKILGHTLGSKENINVFLPLVENLKLINLGRNCAVKRAAKNPVILIVDPTFEEAPWEMMTTLQGQPVCRILSLHLLYALFKYHQDSIVNGYRIISVNKAYSLVNPDKDLDNCEKCLKQFLKNELPWVKADLGKKPDPKELLDRLQNIPLYFYCGHGSGTQYLNNGDLKKSFIKGMILLFGCCSNLPKNTGGRTPHQNYTYTYIINGSPCLIGCLHDVNSTETDAVCLDMLSKIMPVVRNEGDKKMVNQPKESNVLKALVEAKNTCNKYWTTCSFVARGIPCKTAAGKF